MYPNQDIPQGYATNNASAGLMGSAKSNTPVSVSTTEQQTLSLHESVSELSKLVSVLFERLNPVLRSPNPSSVGEGRKDEELPTLANAIRQSRYIVQNVNGQLNDILGRLDI